MPKISYVSFLDRIAAAMAEARGVFARFTPGEVKAQYKAGHDPVTEADHAVDALLKKHLLQPGEGWFSEETSDDFSRLNYELVWIVDPLDGTREFVEGVPEFCVSIALVERGRPVAGGICNPATNEVFLGSIDSGLTYNGTPARASSHSCLQDAIVLASRSEIKRGEWRAFEDAPFRIEPKGSVAYKLARVSAGLADATFTLTPKHEWDVAAGAVLVTSGGGTVRTLDGAELICNRKDALLPGLVASGRALNDELWSFLNSYLQTAGK